LEENNGLSQKELAEKVRRYLPKALTQGLCQGENLPMHTKNTLQIKYDEIE
jgi:uncharacterized protein YidB (DUF937 family)